MGETEFSNTEPLPKENGLSVMVDDGAGTAKIIFQPDHAPEYFLLCISLILIIVPPLMSTLFSVKTQDVSLVGLWVILFLFLGGSSLSMLYKKRFLHCIINKHNGTVEYFRGGILDSHYDVKKVSFHVSNITGIEMKSYPGRMVVKFQISLLLGSSKERLELSWASLSFSECQKNAETIRNFISSELPLVATDAA